MNSMLWTIFTIAFLAGQSCGRPQQTVEDVQIKENEESLFAFDLTTITPSGALNGFDGSFDNEDLLRPVSGGRIRGSNGVGGTPLEVTGDFTPNTLPPSSTTVPSKDLEADEPNRIQQGGRPQPFRRPNNGNMNGVRQPSALTQQTNQNQRPSNEDKKPLNYQFEYNVDQEEFRNYYGHRESGQGTRVDGTYYTWMPNGRLVRVDYYVDGASGFRPTITYVNDYQPNWGTRFFDRD